MICVSRSTRDPAVYVERIYQTHTQSKDDTLTDKEHSIVRSNTSTTLSDSNAYGS